MSTSYTVLNVAVTLTGETYDYDTWVRIIDDPFIRQMLKDGTFRGEINPNLVSPSYASPVDLVRFTTIRPENSFQITDVQISESNHDVEINLNLSTTDLTFYQDLVRNTYYFVPRMMRSLIRNPRLITFDAYTLRPTQNPS